METRKTKEQIVRKLTDMLEAATNQRDKFVAKVQEDPANAMSWSADMFRAAAEFSFANEGLAFFDVYTGECDPVQVFLNYVRQDILRQARSMSNKSTSVPSNYMDDCVIECRAKFLDSVLL